MRKWLWAVVLFVLAGLASAQDYRIGEDGKFYQILRWGRTSASAYEVEVEKRGDVKVADESGSEDWQWTQVLSKRVEPQAKRGEDESLEVSLPSGRYRFRIASFNALGRKGATSAWTAFRILPAKKPAAAKINADALEIVKGSSTFTLHLTGRDLIEGAKVTLVPKSKKDFAPVEQISAKFSDSDDWLDASFPAAALAKGNYDIVIENPGGLKQTLANVPVRFVDAPKVAKAPAASAKTKTAGKKDLNLSLGWSWMPYSGILEDNMEHPHNNMYSGGNTYNVSDVGYSKFYYPLGFYFRLSYLPKQFARSSLGFEGNFIYNYIYSKKKDTLLGDATLVGHGLFGDFVLLWQLWLQQRTLALNARFGFGWGGTPSGVYIDYSDYSDSSTHNDIGGDALGGYFSLNAVAGLSVEKIFWRNMFFEIGADYFQPFWYVGSSMTDKLSPGEIHVNAGLGWRMGVGAAEGEGAKEKKEPKYDTNISLGWSYLPTVPALKKRAEEYFFHDNFSSSGKTMADVGFPTTYYPIGAYFRVDWLPFEFARSALGFDLSMSFHYLYGKKDTEWGKATATGLYMMADAMLLYRIPLMQNTAAANLRAGVGFGGTPAGIHYEYENKPANYYSFDEDWNYGFGSWDLKIGASFEKTILKNWFVELGADYSQPILPTYAIDGGPDFWFEYSPYIGNFRVWLGTGWRVGPERDAEGNRINHAPASKRKHDFNLSLGWSYVPFIGPLDAIAKQHHIDGWFNGQQITTTVYDAGYGKTFYPFGYYTRLSWLPFEFGIHAVGFEWNFSLHGIRSKKDTPYGRATVDGAYMVLDLGLLWKIWFQQRTLALAFRFGAGAEGFPPGGIIVHYDNDNVNGNSDFWSYFGSGAANIMAGVSVEKILWRGLFAELGMDYLHPVKVFDNEDAADLSSTPGSIRVYLGLGWRFGPER